jgi:hypothetical protein
MTESFTPEQRRTLEFAPLWVLSIVAGRYRGFDAFTVQAFDDALASAQSSGGVARDVAVSVRSQLPEILDRYGVDPRSIVTGLLEVEGLLGALPDDEADRFRSMLVDSVGMGIARARGPFGVEATREDLERVEMAASIVAATPPLSAAFDE